MVDRPKQAEATFIVDRSVNSLNARFPGIDFRLSPEAIIKHPAFNIPPESEIVFRVSEFVNNIGRQKIIERGCNKVVIGIPGATNVGNDTFLFSVIEENVHRSVISFGTRFPEPGAEPSKAQNKAPLAPDVLTLAAQEPPDDDVSIPSQASPVEAAFFGSAGPISSLPGPEAAAPGVDPYRGWKKIGPSAPPDAMDEMSDPVERRHRGTRNRLSNVLTGTIIIVTGAVLYTVYNESRRHFGRTYLESIPVPVQQSPSPAPAPGPAPAPVEPAPKPAPPPAPEPLPAPVAPSPEDITFACWHGINTAVGYEIACYLNGKGRIPSEELIGVDARGIQKALENSGSTTETIQFRKDDGSVCVARGLAFTRDTLNTQELSVYPSKVDCNK